MCVCVDWPTICFERTWPNNTICMASEEMNMSSIDVSVGMPSLLHQRCLCVVNWRTNLFRAHLVKRQPTGITTTHRGQASWHQQLETRSPAEPSSTQEARQHRIRRHFQACRKMTHNSTPSPTTTQYKPGPSPRD